MENTIDRRNEDIEETKDNLNLSSKFAEEKKEEFKPENKSNEQIRISEQNAYLPEFSEEKPITSNTNTINKLDRDELDDDVEGELKEAMNDISRLPECKMKLPQNQLICEEYKQLINNSPLTMENTDVINNINIISENKLKSWINDGLTEEQEKELRDKEKHKVLENYFDVPPNLLDILENINTLSNKIRQEEVVYEDIVFEETELKGTKNLIDFLMNEMYFQASNLFNFNLKTNLDPTINPKPNTTSILNTKRLKYQIGKDIIRIGKPININGIDVLLTDIAKFKTEYIRCDFYNQILMDIMDKYDLIIDKNIITIIDICLIQQLISLLSDTIVRTIVTLELIQNSKKREYSYTIVLTEEEKYIIVSLKQYFISLKNLNLYPDFNTIPDSGELVTTLKINLNNINYNLSYDSNNINDSSNYSLFVSFNINGDNIPLTDPSKLIEEQNNRRFQQNNEEDINNINNNSNNSRYMQNIRNVGSNAVEYAKENPGSVAAAAGVSSVLAAGVGTILALGLLGGKTKKRLRKKRLTKNRINKGKRKGSKKRKTKVTQKQIFINNKLTKRHNKHNKHRKTYKKKL